MAKCEQFIYTAAKIGSNEGYQIIAKSSGITDKITNNLAEYLYPLGVKVNEFQESRSMVLLPDSKICYSIVKNIGKGYDGRSGTLYNHTFVIEKDEFKKLDFDSRIFENYFVRNDLLRGELKSLKIERTSIPSNFEKLNKLDPTLLQELLHRLFRRNKIAIVKTDELDLIQNLLSILPPSLRVIPFSTLVLEPDRQYKYNIIQIPEAVIPKIQSPFVIINPNDDSLSRKKRGLENLEELVQIIQNKNASGLITIQKDFEKIPDRLTRVRRVKKEELLANIDLKPITKNNFTKLKNQIKKLYSSKKFNEASPRVMLLITKKIRSKITKEMKNKKKNSANTKQIFAMVEILLNHMHFLQDYSEKNMSRPLRNEISDEIIKLEIILDEYSEPELVQTPYVFKPLEVMVQQCIQAVNNTIAVGLWAMGFHPKRKE